VADYSELFRQNPQLFAQVMASLSGAVDSSTGAEQQQPVEPPPPVEAPPPVQQAPPVEPMPMQAPAPAPPPAQAQPVQPPPAPEPPPVEPPPPVEEVAPAPTGPVDMRVAADAERPTGSLGQQQGQLLDEDVAAANEAGDSFAREGDAKALAASEAAKIYGTQAGVADRYARAAETNYANHQDRAARMRQMEDEDFARLQQEPPKPGHLKNIFNVITGIIGAAAGGEQGAAIGMLRQHVNRQAEEDAQERAAAERRIEVSGKIQDRILRDSSNEFDAAAKLVAGQWIVASRQLEQVANESNVPAFREQALRLSIQAKEQARGLLKHNVETQVQQAAAAQAAEAKARAGAMRTQWDKLTQRDLELLASQGLLPIDVAKKLAETQKAQREAPGDAAKSPRAVPGRDVTDPAAFASARDVDIAKFRETDAKMRALGKTLDKLDQSLAKHGTEAFGEEAANMDALAASALGTIKDVKTLGTLDSGLLTFGEKLLGDPTSWYKSGSSVRTRIKASREALQEEVEAMAEGIGLSRKAETTVDDQAAAFGAVPLAGSP